MKIVRCLFVLLLIAVPAFAEQARQDLPVAPDPNTWLDNYWAKVSPKIDFGVANLLMGWTEIITEPIDYYHAAPPKKCRFLHAAMGIGEGALNAVLDKARDQRTSFLGFPGHGVKQRIRAHSQRAVNRVSVCAP